MGKRIQKLKAKQPRAIRLNAKEQRKTNYSLLEARRKCDNFIKCHSKALISDRYIGSRFIIGFRDTCIRQMIHALIDHNISFKVDLPNNPIIDRVAEDILNGLDIIK